MVRPLRIEYPGAWYHVMNLGRRGEQIFLEQRDYKTFLELLMQSVREYGLKTHSSVSSKVERVKSQMIKDRRFRKRVDELVPRLSKRQTET